MNCGRCSSTSIDVVFTCDESPLATRCNACGAIEVTSINKATVIKTCRYQPCSKRFETTIDRYGTNRTYCSGECRMKAYSLGRKRLVMKSYLVEVWRPRVGEKSGAVASHRPNDPDHSFFISASNSESAKEEVSKNPGVKKGDTYRLSEVAEESKNRSAGLAVTGKVK